MQHESTKIIKARIHHDCTECGRLVYPNSNCYRIRIFSVGNDWIFGFNLYVHTRCFYKRIQRRKRFDSFKEVCTHPQKFRDWEYSYILGEAVMQPELERCGLCGKVVR